MSVNKRFGLSPVDQGECLGTGSGFKDRVPQLAKSFRRESANPLVIFDEEYGFGRAATT